MSITLGSNRRIDIQIHEYEYRTAGDASSSSSTSSSSTSSIGMNSDISRRSGSEGDDGDDEVESKYEGALDSMDALEEVLPIRRGISNFYPGKSKSFTSLADAESADVKDIVKPENAYTRRRRNLLSFNHIWGGGGISKRHISASRSTVALAMALSSSESIISNTSDESNSSSPPKAIKFSPWQSCSMADLSYNLMTNANSNHPSADR